MSQNPYAHYDNTQSDPQNEPGFRRKTSGLAIAALICSLLFCPAFIGVILGVIAIFVIGGSEGRLKGRGMAIIAVLIGLLMCAVQVGGTLIFVRTTLRFQSEVMEPSFAAFRKLDSGDVSAIRELLSPSVSSNMTDSEILAFRDAYQAVAGEVVGEMRSLGKVASATFAVEDPGVLQKLKVSSSGELVSQPTSFTKEHGAVVFKSDAVTNITAFAFSNPIFKGSVVEIAVVIPGKPPILLTDVSANTSAPPEKKPDAPAPGGNGG